MPGINENNSISSNKSKSSAKSKSMSQSQSQSQSSKNVARKKRTIEGVHDGASHHLHHTHHHHPHAHQQDLPSSAYSFRRTESSASSSTTVTAGNNTSTDNADNDQGGSMKPRDRSHHGELPPLSHPSHNSFDESGGRRFAHHRRDHSGTSTTSSLSVGGFSLSSHEGPHRGTSAETVSWLDYSRLVAPPLNQLYFF